MATTKEDTDLCWSAFIPTMQFGKRKLVVWKVAALLEHLEEPPFQAVCLFFLDSKKNRPVQGHVATGDYYGRFQGSTSTQVDDAAFDYSD